MKWSTNYNKIFQIHCRPTFIRVCKKKSTEGFQSVPYVVALFSAMVWLYYASLKSNEILLITANTIGCVVETIYIAIYIAFAPKQARVLNKTLSLCIYCYCFLVRTFVTIRTIYFPFMLKWPISNNALTKNFGLWDYRFSRSLSLSLYLLLFFLVRTFVAIRTIYFPFMLKWPISQIMH